MKRYISVFCLILSFCFVGLPPGYTLPQSIVNDLVEGNYGAAERALGALDDSAEQLFGRAVLAQKRGEFRRAQRLFRRLIREHPNTTRATDAEFYLDRIKLRDTETEAPPVRVQLDQSSRISGTLTGTARVEDESGKQLRELGPGMKWNVRAAGNGTLTHAVRSQSGTVSANGELRIRPSSDSAFLATDGTRYRGDFLFRRTEEGSLALINQLPVEKYLYGVVRKEIAPNWPTEVVRAQAVAARSFVVARMRGADNGEDYDVQSNHFSQVYGGYDAEDPQIRRAVDATAGQVLTYNNQVVPAYYHANSGGHIETAEAVWNSAKTPYITPKKDTWSVSAQHATWESTLTQNELARSLRASDVPNPSTPLNLRREETLSSGRTQTISYGSTGAGRAEVNANDFRIAAGPRTLKSTWFESIDEGSSRIEFEGRGWGHGIGLSQWGARAMAKAGQSHRQILNFYYENAHLLDGYGLGAAHGETVINE
jgi:stage II sporulation protein D